MELNLPHRIGITPQLRLSFRQPPSEYVIPMISTGQRNLLTIRTVCPDREFTMINLAFRYVAMAQAECETASSRLLRLLEKKMDGPDNYDLATADTLTHTSGMYSYKERKVK